VGGISRQNGPIMSWESNGFASHWTGFIMDKRVLARGVLFSINHFATTFLFFFPNLIRVSLFQPTISLRLPTSILLNEKLCPPGPRKQHFYKITNTPSLAKRENIRTRNIQGNGLAHGQPLPHPKPLQTHGQLPNPARPRPHK
jgi:hypothetical protein